MDTNTWHKVTENSVSSKLQGLLDSFQEKQQRCSQLQTVIDQEEVAIDLVSQQVEEQKKSIQVIDEARHSLRQKHEILLETERALLSEISQEKQHQHDLYLQLLRLEDDTRQLKQEFHDQQIFQTKTLEDMNSKYMKQREELKQLLWIRSSADSDQRDDIG